MSLTLFVDTNVFLSLYSMSEDDIEQIRKLFVMSQSGDVDFLLPQQVVDEFIRNREAKIAESIKDFEKQTLAKVPTMARDLPDFSEYKRAQDDYRQQHAKLLNTLKQRALNRSLEADKLINEIFEKSDVIPANDEILKKASQRVKQGNPPGKNGSLGDAINWECILPKAPVLDNLHFVSHDRDYRSPLEENRFNEFLERELMNESACSVSFYRSLKALFKANFPGIELAAFEQAGTLVAEFASSWSYATTHEVVASLSKVNSLTASQGKRLLAAASENSQVSWIIHDDDVKEFLLSLPQKVVGWTPQMSRELSELFEPPKAAVQELEEDFPF